MWKYHTKYITLRKSHNFYVSLYKILSMFWKHLSLAFLLLIRSSKSSCDDTQCPDVSFPLVDNRLNKDKFTVMQYNVEWFFLDYYSAADCPGNGCTWKNESMAVEHMTYLYDTIHQLNPDFINFCEIEGCDELNALGAMLDNEYNSYLLKGTDTATGQNVGMLTKIDPLKSLIRTSEKFSYPIEGSQCGYTGDTQTTGVSKHYISDFTMNNINISIISAHLIAFPTVSTRCAQREAQASILQKIIYEKIQNGSEVIMMGDFNDFDNIVLDVNNNTPTSHVLDILKGNDGELKDKYKLHSSAELIFQKDRFSEWYDSDGNCNTKSINDYSMIDHVLVTPNLFDKITSADIYHGYKEYCGKMNSDHYPVIVEFTF